MELVVYIWNVLNRVLNDFAKTVDNKIIQIIIVYWILFFIIGITVFLFRLTIYLIYEGISHVYRKYNHSKNIIIIRWEVELKVFFERMYFNLKIYKVNHLSFDNNKFRLSRKYTPSGIFETIVSIVKKMITLDFIIFLYGLLLLFMNFKYQRIIYIKL